MRLKGLFVIMLCLSLAVSCFTGCGGGGENTTTAPAGTTGATEPVDTTEPTIKETEPEVEPLLPAIDGENVRMFYDDRLTLAELTGADAAEATISAQKVTSKMVGTEDSDMGVLYFDSANKTLIAIGTGTAKVSVGDKEYNVTVESAPISLFMITGHSLGAGSKGNSKESIVIADGKAYSTADPELAGESSKGIGIGFAAGVKPNADIHAFNAGGAGAEGEDSGIAWQWNQLTGEKVWVLNAAVGGTCLPEWIKGEACYENAVKLFRYAEGVLANEIAAGHYRLKDMAIIYHSAANFGYKQVIYTRDDLYKWYDSLWNGFKTDLAMDIDGDGTEETVQSLGLVPIWAPAGSGANGIHDDKPANYFMSLSDTYPDVFMASLAGREWITDSGIVKNFPDAPYAATHTDMPAKPTNTKELFADGVHYNQVAYNASGIDIATNLYTHLRGESKVEKLTIKKSDGNSLYDEIKLSRVGSSAELYLECEPYTVDDLTFTVTDNVKIEFPLVLVATASGEGKLTVSQGDTVLAEYKLIVG